MPKGIFKHYIEDLEMEWERVSRRVLRKKTFKYKKLEITTQQKPSNESNFPLKFDIDRFNVSILTEKHLPGLKSYADEPSLRPSPSGNLCG